MAFVLHSTALFGVVDAVDYLGYDGGHGAAGPSYAEPPQENERTTSSDLKEKVLLTLDPEELEAGDSLIDDLRGCLKATTLDFQIEYGTRPSGDGTSWFKHKPHKIRYIGRAGFGFRADSSSNGLSSKIIVTVWREDDAYLGGPIIKDHEAEIETEIKKRTVDRLVKHLDHAPVEEAPDLMGVVGGFLPVAVQKIRKALQPPKTYGRRERRPPKRVAKESTPDE